MSNDSGNLFQEVLQNANAVEERLLGPAYPYYKNVRTPSEIGMSDRGTIRQMTKNIDGLIDYVEVLVTGKGSASTTGRPLGNRFFLRTGGKCADTETGEDRDRHIYINNVPQGNIPFISSGLGTNFSDFRGLIPGAMSNLNVLNPFAILQAFLAGGKPKCQPLTMETIDINNNRSSETHYVTLVDIQNMDPCSFMDRRNPITGRVCRETFQGNMQTQNYAEIGLPDDPAAQLYFASLSVLGIYVLYCLMEKAK
jgi:hypothetical protein